MTNVRCTVDSCHYWGNNDICKAKDITVEPNGASSGSRGAMSFEAGDLDARMDRNASSSKSGSSDKSQNQGKKAQATTSSDTLCSTFKPKGAETKH